MQGLPIAGVFESGSPLDTIAHIIQVALTPVFLLSGIATLLSVFSTRLARVADRTHAVTSEMASADEQQVRVLNAELAFLHRRSIALDVAVILGALGGAATCGAVLTLFLGSLSNATVASILFLLFGGAVVCALGAIAAFTAEMLMAGIGMRAQLAATERTAQTETPSAEMEPQEPGATC